MARRWTLEEEEQKRSELEKFYTVENKTISEIGKILRLGESTVYDRLLRLGIKPDRSKKLKFNNKRNDIFIPKERSCELSEFLGILLGDGHLTPTQVTVTLGSKEISYVNYVVNLVKNLFKINPKTLETKKGYRVIYFGSTEAVKWLIGMGLVFNKVKNQVDIPVWIFSNSEFIKSFLRGFFDTDGSIYKLRFGIQVAFINRSIPMLNSIRRGLVLAGFFPSQISQFRIYLTRRKDVNRFFAIIKPANIKHRKRFLLFAK